MTGLVNGGSPKDAFALHCRGDVRLYFNDQDCTPTSKKGRALLAVLAAEQRPLGRVKIIDLLWSDRQEEQARASLRTLLADLKEQFGDAFDRLLDVDRERVALNPSVRTDLTDPTIARPVGELFEGLDHIDPELDEWLRVEREKWRVETTRYAVSAAPTADRPVAKRPWLPLLVPLAVLLVIGIISFSERWRPKPQQQLIAILPLQGALSPTQRLYGDYLVSGLRDDLIASGQVRVLGATASARLAEGGYEPPVVKQLFAVDLLLAINIRRLGDSERIVARLLDTSTGAERWSADYVIPVGSATETRDGVTHDLADRLRNSLALGRGDERLERWAMGPEGLRLAEAKRLIRMNRPQQALQARHLLLDLVASHPDNMPALAALAVATMAASDHPYVGGMLPSSEARTEAATYANRAIRLAPNAADGYGALGASQMETAKAIAPLERAVELEPGNYLYRTQLGRALEFEDRYEEAFRHQVEAVAMEPLEPLPMINLIRAANELNRDEEIRRRIAAYAKRGASSSNLGYVRAYYDFLRDDNVGCIRNFAAVPEQEIAPPQRNVILFCLMALGERDRALRLVADEDSLRRDVLFGDVEIVQGRVRKLGHDFWKRHYESLGAAELLVSNGRSAFLVDEFDRSFNNVEDFIAEGGFLTLYPQPLMVALKAAGRGGDFRKLRDHLYKTMQSARARPGGDQWESFNGATIALVDGQPDRAARLLEACAPTCIFSVLQRDIAETALFRTLSGNPRFDSVIRRYRQMINRQRKELSLPALPLS